jgi:hypothetical protein
VSLAKHFNFKPKEYSAPSQGVRSKKIIRTWAAQMKTVKMEKQPKADKKGGASPAGPKPEAASGQ